MRALPSLERGLTECLAPWSTLVIGSWALGKHCGSRRWGIATGLGLGAIPQAGISWYVHRQQLTDRHVSRREDRPLVITAIMGSVAATMAAQRVGQAPVEVRGMTDGALASLIVAGGISSKWKVSLHTAVLTGMVVSLGGLASPKYKWVGTLVPILAWSRVRLGDHTVGQTAAGVALGVVGGAFGVSRGLRGAFVLPRQP